MLKRFFSLIFVFAVASAVRGEVNVTENDLRDAAVMHSELSDLGYTNDEIAQIAILRAAVAQEVGNSGFVLPAKNENSRKRIMYIALGLGACAALAALCGGAYYWYNQHQEAVLAETVRVEAEKKQAQEAAELEAARVEVEKKLAQEAAEKASQQQEDLKRAVGRLEKRLKKVEKSSVIKGENIVAQAIKDVDEKMNQGTAGTFKNKVNNFKQQFEDKVADTLGMKKTS